jgi:serine/threonine protein phosphatase PrpC
LPNFFQQTYEALKQSAQKEADKAKEKTEKTNEVDSTEHEKQMQHMAQVAIKQSLEQMQNYLLEMAQEDDEEYGTTCVLAVLTEDTRSVVIGNVGDSRAVLYRHKPKVNDKQSEQERSPYALRSTRHMQEDEWIEVMTSFGFWRH